MSPAAQTSRSLFFALATLMIVLAVGLLERLPTASELRYTEGKVLVAEWQGMRRPRFVIRVVDNHRTFQARLPSVLDRPLTTEVPVGSLARIGHTSSTVGISDRLQVFSLSIDGRSVYTLDQFIVARRQDDREVLLYIFIPVTFGTALCLWHWRRHATRVRRST